MLGFTREVKGEFEIVVECVLVEAIACFVIFFCLRVIVVRLCAHLRKLSLSCKLFFVLELDVVEYVRMKENFLIF